MDLWRHSVDVLSTPFATTSFLYNDGKWPLVEFYQPLAGVALYLGVLASFTTFMEERKGFELKWFTVFHNAFLCIFSIIMFIGTISAVLEANDRFFNIYCDEARRYTTSRIAFWTYVFYLSKYYEFVDTVILVLKKRDLQFLHVYHHCVTVIVVYLGVESQATYTWIAVALNTFVHIFMYFYYAIAVLGYRPWWKRHLTLLQMVQFWINMSGLLCWALLRAAGYAHCAGDWWSWSTCFFINATFYALFSLFYEKSYKDKKLKKQ